MCTQDESIPEPILFSSLSANDDYSESESTCKRTNCRRKSRKNNDDDDLPGMRSKFMLEGVRQELYNLQLENVELRRVVMDNVDPPEVAERILRNCEAPPIDIFLPSIVLEDEEEKRRFDEDDDDVENPKSEDASYKRKLKTKQKGKKNSSSRSLSSRSSSSIEKKRKSKSKKHQQEKCESDYKAVLEMNFELDNNEFLVEAFRKGYAY